MAIALPLLMGLHQFAHAQDEVDASPKAANQGFMYDNNRAALNISTTILSIGESNIDSLIEVYIPSMDGAAESIPSSWNTDIFYKPIFMFDIANLEDQYSDFNCKQFSNKEYVFEFKFRFPNLAQNIAGYIEANYESDITMGGLAAITLIPPYHALDIGVEIRTQGKEDFIVIDQKGSLSDPSRDVFRTLDTSPTSPGHLMSCSRVRTIIEEATSGKSIFWARMYGYTTELTEPEQVVASFTSSIMQELENIVEENDKNSKNVKIVTETNYSENIARDGIQLGLDLQTPPFIPIQGSAEMSLFAKTTEISDQELGLSSQITGSRVFTGRYINEIRQTVDTQGAVLFRNWPQADREAIMIRIWNELSKDVFLPVDAEKLQLAIQGNTLVAQGAVLPDGPVEAQLSDNEMLALKLNDPNDLNLYFYNQNAETRTDRISISNVVTNISNKPATIDLDYSVAASLALSDLSYRDSGVGAFEQEYAQERRELIDNMLAELGLDRDTLMSTIQDLMDDVDRNAARRITEYGAMIDEARKDAVVQANVEVSNIIVAGKDAIEVSMRKVEQQAGAVNGLADDLSGSFAYPQGTIIWWYPPSDGADVPDGWAIADGRTVTLASGEKLQTPNLFDRGAIGGSIDNAGTAIGENSVTIKTKTDDTKLTIAQMPAHSHEFGWQRLVNFGIESSCPTWLGCVGKKSVDVRLLRDNPDNKERLTSVGGNQGHAHSLSFEFDNRAASILLVPLMKL